MQAIRHSLHLPATALPPSVEDTAAVATRAEATPAAVAAEVTLVAATVAADTAVAVAT